MQKVAGFDKILCPAKISAIIIIMVQILPERMIKEILSLFLAFDCQCSTGVLSELQNLFYLYES